MLHMRTGFSMTAMGVWCELLHFQPTQIRDFTKARNLYSSGKKISPLCDVNPQIGIIWNDVPCSLFIAVHSNIVYSLPCQLQASTQRYKKCYCQIRIWDNLVLNRIYCAWRNVNWANSNHEFEDNLQFLHLGSLFKKFSAAVMWNAHKDSFVVLFHTKQGHLGSKGLARIHSSWGCQMLNFCEYYMNIRYSSWYL